MKIQETNQEELRETQECYLKIVINNKKFIFNTPFHLVISEESDGYLALNEELEVSGFGSTPTEAKKDAFTYLLGIWDEFTHQDDSILGTYARKRKKR